MKYTKLDGWNEAMDRFGNVTDPNTLKRVYSTELMRLVMHVKSDPFTDGYLKGIESLFNRAIRNRTRALEGVRA